MMMPMRMTLDQLIYRFFRTGLVLGAAAAGAAVATSLGR